MVYGIVKQSRGSIWVYSEPGQGTTFKIYFPSSRKDRKDSSSAVRGEVLRGSETVLLTEDDEMVRTLAREVLQSYGYRVLEAPNGSAAISVCEQHDATIHLLVTDVVMPEMSGRDLVARISQLRPGMKVLYMSGYSDGAVVHHGVLDEDTAFIQKPFAPETLARKIRKVLDGAG
jgi:DNA-binding NtrC family response regulator